MMSLSCFILILLPVALAAPINLDCNVPFDLVMVIDGSDSLKEAEFNATKKFVLDVIETLTLGQNAVQVGILVYSTFIGGTIDLGQFNSFEILRIFINNLQQPRQGTATDIAILSMKNMFDNRSGARQNVRKIGVVLTDGRSTSPTATINAARSAKNSGIEIFAIGYGTDVFVYELEQIASDKQKTLILTNSMTDQVFIQEFEDKMRLRICAVTTTSTTPATTVKSLPSTEKQVLGDYCPTCMKDVNFGYKPFPGDCTRYYDVRPDSNGGSIQEVKKCSFGTFWDQSLLTCQYTWLVNCNDNPCSSYTAGTLEMAGVCSGYWACSNYRSNATCCPRPNQRYVQGVGCLEDFSCTTPCPDDDSDKLIQSQRCYRYSYQSDPSRYYEENHGRNISRHCAPGTEFDPVSCSCSIFSNLVSSQIQTCNPEIKFDFNSNRGVFDISGNDILAGTINVGLNGQTASFNKKGMINIWYYSNSDFKTSLVIDFKFMVSGPGFETEALVSNCIGSDIEEASILILADRASNLVLFRTVTYDDTTVVALPFNPNIMNTVTYIYNGKTLKASVNSDIAQSALSGDIERRQTGIILGAASHWESLNGQIDDFSLYRCLTGSAGQLVS